MMTAPFLNLNNQKLQLTKVHQCECNQQCHGVISQGLVKFSKNDVQNTLKCTCILYLENESPRREELFKDCRGVKGLELRFEGIDLRLRDCLVHGLAIVSVYDQTIHERRANPSQPKLLTMGHVRQTFARQQFQVGLGLVNHWVISDIELNSSFQCSSS